MEKIRIKDPPDPIDLNGFKECWEAYQKVKVEKTQDIIRDFIKDNLRVTVDSNSGYLEVSLSIKEKDGKSITFAQDYIYVGGHDQ